MSEENFDAESQSDHPYENVLTEPFPVMNLPQDILLQILQTLDNPTLASLCRTNKSLLNFAGALLWRRVDFVAVKDECVMFGDDLMAAQGAFFYACSSLMVSNPSRWMELASRVQVLRLIKMPGIGVPESKPEIGISWVFESWASEVDRTVFDVMTSFKNLEELHFYIKKAYEFTEWNDEITRRLEGKLTKLRKLDVGGNVPKPVMHAILSRPETLEQLSIITLQDGSASSNCHSKGLLFLSDLRPVFTNLKRLHLCKHAELGEDPGDQGLNWDWPRDNDFDVLHDWAEFLKKISSTLVELTLEDLYLDYSVHGRIPINFEEDESEEWTTLGALSSLRFREVILPVLAELEWPALSKLCFVGVHVSPMALEKAGVLDRLGEKVDITVTSGRKARHSYECTPIVISPPYGTFQDEEWDIEPLPPEVWTVDRS